MVQQRITDFQRQAVHDHVSACLGSPVMVSVQKVVEDDPRYSNLEVGQEYLHLYLDHAEIPEASVEANLLPAVRVNARGTYSVYAIFLEFDEDYETGNHYSAGQLSVLSQYMNACEEHLEYACGFFAKGSPFYRVYDGVKNVSLWFTSLSELNALLMFEYGLPIELWVKGETFDKGASVELGKTNLTVERFIDGLPS